MKKIEKGLTKDDKGLSPMVATIVLIAMVMVIAGVLAAGLSGGTPSEPREAGLEIEGLTPGSKKVKIYLHSGDTLKEAFDTDGENIAWRNLELRVAGENVEADVLKVTSLGDEIENGKEIDFSAGDIIDLENMKPGLKSEDDITLVWVPNDQILYTETV